MSSIALIVGVVGIGAGAIEANQSKKAAQGAVSSQQAIVNNLQYQPIDIAKLTADAHAQAVANATQSLALERALQPGVADARQNLQQSISDQLKQGGNLPPDVVDQVTQAARVGSGSSGTLGGSSVPLTAQMLGVSALGLLNQRQNNAANLLAANPLPTAGLDPGSLASLEAQQNAAQNQFNLAKAGVNSNLVNSTAQVNSAQAGANAGLINSFGNLLTKQNSSSTGPDTSFASKFGSLFQSQQNPANNLVSVGGSGQSGLQSGVLEFGS